MTYPTLPTLAWDGAVYHNPLMNTDEALLPTGGYPTAHALSLIHIC